MLDLHSEEAKNKPKHSTAILVGFLSLVGFIVKTKAILFKEGWKQLNKSSPHYVIIIGVSIFLGRIMLRYLKMVCCETTI